MCKLMLITINVQESHNNISLTISTPDICTVNSIANKLANMIGTTPDIIRIYSKWDDGEFRLTDRHSTVADAGIGDGDTLVALVLAKCHSCGISQEQAPLIKQGNMAYCYKC